MFFAYWLYKTLKRRRAAKKRSKADGSRVAAERDDAPLANVPETGEPDDRRDTTTTTTTSVAVEDQHASGRRDVDRVVTTASAGNDRGTSGSTAFTGNDDGTMSIDRLLVMMETLTNKMNRLEDRFETRMESMERRISRLSDGERTVTPNSNVMTRVTALEARKRKNDRLLNDLSRNVTACDKRLCDVETDYNYTKCSNRELVEMHDVLSKRMENLGAALNIDVSPDAYGRPGRSTSDDEMEMYQMMYGD